MHYKYHLATLRFLASVRKGEEGERIIINGLTVDDLERIEKNRVFADHGLCVLRQLESEVEDTNDE